MLFHTAQKKKSSCLSISKNTRIKDKCSLLPAMDLRPVQDVPRETIIK